MSLINGTAKVLNGAISDNDIPGEMLQSLKEDVFVFSGLKTHAQLLEASKLLLTPEGTVKSFAAFSKDIESLKTAYNEHYLEAEYQFAITSSQMAGKWAQVTDDYDLQYRTASDDRVREAHRALHDITLPSSDSFWLSYYPPNGWKCRCTANKVRKGKYPNSDSVDSVSKGEKATTQIGADGKNKLEIFRFNPGAKKVVFPPAHPYRKTAGAKTVEKQLKAKIEVTNRPEGIDKYESELGLKLNNEIFTMLTKKTTFRTQVLPKGRNGGAYYSPDNESVYIPVDDRRRNSKWKAESVVYHEFGHAADWQNDFKKMPIVTDLMSKYRKEFAKKKNEQFKELARKIDEAGYKAHADKDFDRMEQAGCAADTLMSLDSRFGNGHSVAYFKKAGMSEAEFLAHTFENRYSGNPLFKELMPELYEETIKLAEALRATLE
jgi:hypothetical protein